MHWELAGKWETLKKMSVGIVVDLFGCRWRWTFIIDASFTAVLAVFGFKYLPDYPGNGTSWLSEEVDTTCIPVCSDVALTIWLGPGT